MQGSGGAVTLMATVAAGEKSSGFGYREAHINIRNYVTFHGNHAQEVEPVCASFFSFLSRRVPMSCLVFVVCVVRRCLLGGPSGAFRDGYFRRAGCGTFRW